MLFHFRATFAVVGAIGVVCACQNGEPQPDRVVNSGQGLTSSDSALIALARSAVVDYSAFRAELRVPPEIAAGRPMPLELVVRNTSDRPVWLKMGDSAFAFNFIVSGADGAVVWDRARGLEGAVPLILIERPVPPGDSVRFSDTWNQLSNTGRRIAPGTYSVRGTLNTQEDPENQEDMKTDPMPIIVSQR